MVDLIGTWSWEWWRSCEESRDPDGQSLHQISSISTEESHGEACNRADDWNTRVTSVRKHFLQNLLSVIISQDVILRVEAQCLDKNHNTRVTLFYFIEMNFNFKEKDRNPSLSPQTQRGRTSAAASFPQPPRPSLDHWTSRSCPSAGSHWLGLLKTDHMRKVTESDWSYEESDWKGLIYMKKVTKRDWKYELHQRREVWRDSPNMKTLLSSEAPLSPDSLRSSFPTFSVMYS